jgi:hypothetical protein
LSGDATAWPEYQLRGNPIAAAAFTGPHPELVSNTNWPGSATKRAGGERQRCPGR